MDDGILVKGVRFAMAAPGADTDIFRTTAVGASDFGTGRLKPIKGGAFRVTILLATASIVKLAVANAATAGTQKTGSLNSGLSLPANQLFTFSHGVQPGLWYDYQLASNVAVDYLQIDEVHLGTP